MVTLDCAHSFKNNSVTAYYNIRYQIITELDYLFYLFYLFLI